MPPEAGSHPRARIMGVELHALSMSQALAACSAAVRERRLLRIGMVNAAKIVRMRDDTSLRDAVTGCELVLADGVSVVWASQLLGMPLPERVAGIDLFDRLLDQAARDGSRVYLLGARQHVLDRMLERLRERHPGIVIAGARNGYFGEDEIPAIVEEIRECRAELLFLGMTTPKKEKFIANWATKTGVFVCHGVGGAFDVLSGFVARAPDRWQRLGLEWLHRVFQEPRRLWRRYLVTNSRFLWLVMRELLDGARLRSP